ncbi:exodeoxyribonuclease VII large subunit [Nakamurella endophytica]|uniref:Exodeoxyribonuclease 7 large subunit n=1 Tax=Nakamurella endophytica TaxID=1748367 RepID=A0A917SKY1_9ACTN|nr:exodeoxyribonuclease VII large subunit [Nakamurella endophytica]GGL86900.1 exodeoxyribonuclease 7 large subunit [Nakamurella endophytica]
MTPPATAGGPAASGTSAGGRPAPFPATAADTSRENPWPVRALAQRMAQYVDRAPAAWIEGQIAQLGRSSAAATVFLTLRDAAADISLQVTCARSTLAALPVPPTEGARVVVHGRFEFYAPRGSLSFRADELHPVGLGELLARLERLRRLLAAEGLTAPERKRRLPFLPHTVGLVTGKASAAESDVLANARARWPAVRFRVENPAVQGLSAVTQMIAALQRLDADPHVEVIVLARGGGSTEDLLPFSDEALCRAVSACRTPVVSAIGHEPDHPIVDDVADVRCSTPTDAGKRVVPDARAEAAAVDGLRTRARRALAGWVDGEAARLSRLTAATVLADPLAPVERRADEIGRWRDRGRAVITARIDRDDRDVAHRRAQLTALGPAATLARGYAVVQVGHLVLRSVDEAPAGAQLRIRVADGALAARSLGTEQPDPVDGTADGGPAAPTRAARRARRTT